MSELSSSDQDTQDQGDQIEPCLKLAPRGMFRRVSIISKQPPKSWETVYVPVGGTEEKGRFLDEVTLAIFNHNLDWEAAPFILTSEDDTVNPTLDRIIHRFTPGVGLRFLPRYPEDPAATAYSAFAPLVHLLPHRIRKRYGLPDREIGQWPTHFVYMTEKVPRDFAARLEAAFAAYIWPFLISQSSIGCFDRSDPLRVLAHSLDFWLPHLDSVIREMAGTFGRYKDDLTQEELDEGRASLDPELTADWPLLGGTLWYGEDEARQVATRLVERADKDGRLRAIVDAIRSNRIEDDFSSRWGYAKEDFERKLYRKRSKMKVTFVELTDTIPVHGPDSEVEENIMWQDFFSLLSPKERRIVVCLRSGITKGVDVAKELGYANHSPVSKALARIRRKAATYLQ